MSRAPLRAAAAAFFLGAALALIQMSFFFMLEVHVSSRADSYFTALFFWLVGFLVLSIIYGIIYAPTLALTKRMPLCLDGPGPLAAAGA